VTTETRRASPMPSTTGLTRGGDFIAAGFAPANGMTGM